MSLLVEEITYTVKVAFTRAAFLLLWRQHITWLTWDRLMNLICVFYFSFALSIAMIITYFSVALLSKSQSAFFLIVNIVIFLSAIVSSCDIDVLSVCASVFDGQVKLTTAIYGIGISHALYILSFVRSRTGAQ